jgi:hypothetical protein
MILCPRLQWNCRFRAALLDADAAVPPLLLIGIHRISLSVVTCVSPVIRRPAAARITAWVAQLAEIPPVFAFTPLDVGA